MTTSRGCCMHRDAQAVSAQTLPSDQPCKVSRNPPAGQAHAKGSRMPAAHNPQNRRTVGVGQDPDSLCRLPSPENPCRLRTARRRMEGLDHSRRYVVVSGESPLSSWLPFVQLADLCHGRQLASITPKTRRGCDGGNAAGGKRSASRAASAAAPGEVGESPCPKCRRSSNLPSGKPARVVQRSGFMARRGRTVEAACCGLIVVASVAAVPSLIRSASGSPPLARVGSGTALPLRVGFRGWTGALVIPVQSLMGETNPTPHRAFMGAATRRFYPPRNCSAVWGAVWGLVPGGKA